MTPKNPANNQELWTKYEEHCLNEGLSKNRIAKLRMTYRVIERGFNKKFFSKLKREDIEEFITKLNRNQFKKEDGGEYTGYTKQDFKKFIKQFWKWLHGNNEAYPPEVSWIKTKIAKDERKVPEDVLSHKDVIKLAKSMDKIEYKTLVLMLFDSGFRISEMLSATKKDLTFEEYEGSKKCFWIKCNKSKTFTRKVPIPLFTEDIQQFVNSTYFRGLEDNELIFPMPYNRITMYFKDHGSKVLKNDHVHPHLFRHSSATYWAKELEGNTVALAQRYGWTLSADELKTYVRMSGAYERASVKKVYDNETVKLKAEVDALKAEIEKLQSTIKAVVKMEVEKIKIKASKQ